MLKPFFNFVLDQLRFTMNQISQAEGETIGIKMSLVTKRNLLREFLNQLTNKVTSRPVNLCRFHKLIQINKCQLTKLDMKQNYLKSITNISRTVFNV